MLMELNMSITSQCSCCYHFDGILICVRYNIEPPQTPERNRQGERERDRVQRLQMTSPSIRRQRAYDQQRPIPQPNFGAPPTVPPQPGPVQKYTNWEENLLQGFNRSHAERLRQRGKCQSKQVPVDLEAQRKNDEELQRRQRRDQEQEGR